MRREDFTGGMSGRLVKTPQGYLSFVPAPLPPSLDLSPILVSSLSDADRALGELAGVARTLPNPHLLIRPFMRREAVLSSRIEGTQASLSDLFFFEAAGEERHAGSDVREVANYVRALDYGLDRLSERPITLRLIREIHERLMEGVRGGHMRPGEFRADQNWIGPSGCTFDEATYVPPPIQEMETALYILEEFINEERPSLPVLVRLALIHYQFEAIHPFRDGNGRIGRLLITLVLCSEKVLPLPLLYLSAYFERHRGKYYDCLLAVSQTGDWSSWIQFFLRGVAEQAKDAVRRTDRLLEYWYTRRVRLQSARSSALLLKLVDELFKSPIITAPRTAVMLGVTVRAAQLNIDKLIAEGILQEVTGRQRNRVYVAQDILRILEEPMAHDVR